MPTFRITCSVEQAGGNQQWLVVAADAEEALHKYQNGEDTVFDYEEIEVQDLGIPTVTLESETAIDLDAYIPESEKNRAAVALIKEIKKLCSDKSNTRNKRVRQIRALINQYERM